MAIPSRITPLNYSADFRKSEDNPDNDVIPNSVIQSITMGVRTGDPQFGGIHALGYIQQFDFSQNRDSTPVYQIEPFPHQGSIAGNVLGSNYGFETSDYWPNELIEIIPGKSQPLSININRCTLYTNNLLSAMMYLNAAGTEDTEPPQATLPGLNEVATSQSDYNRYVSIIQQVRPLLIQQFFINPVTFKPIFGRQFEGVWITTMSEAVGDSAVNAPVIEQMKAVAARVRPINKFTDVNTGNLVE